MKIVGFSDKRIDEVSNVAYIRKHILQRRNCIVLDNATERGYKIKLKRRSMNMPKKARGLIAILSIVFLLVLVGCGPKVASKETLSQLEEAKAAVESAKNKKANLEKQIQDARARITQLEQEIKNLQHERDSLRNWLDLLEKGY